jgi:hypothetical protein
VPTQPSVQWVLRVKRPGLQADHLPASSVEIKNEWNCAFPPLYDVMHAGTGTALERALFGSGLE